MAGLPDPCATRAVALLALLGAALAGLIVGLLRRRK